MFPTLTSRNWKYTGEPRSPAGWTQSETAAGPTSTPGVPSSGGQGQTLHTRSPVRFPKDRAIQTASYVFKDLHALMQLCKHEPLRENPVSSPQPEQQGVCQPGTPVAARPAAPAAQRHSFGNTRRACPVSGPVLGAEDASLHKKCQKLPPLWSLRRSAGEGRQEKP